MIALKTVPDVFLVGAAKAGTTSIYNYFKKHPDIFVSPIKEPNFFSTDILTENFSAIYKKNTFLDVDNYFSQNELPDIQLSFVRKAEQYERLFEKASNGQLKAECSTSYLYSKMAAKEIFNVNPDAKILIVLRNPVDRCVSHYQMALRYGHTSLPLMKAINKDLAAKKKGWGISELFVDLSMYTEQLERYLTVFPFEQIKILFYEDLKRNTVQFYQELSLFLGIAFMEDYEMDLRHNAGRMPRFAFLNRIFAATGGKNILKKLFPERTLNWVKSIFFTPTSDINLSTSELEFLKKLFSNDVDKLSKLLQIDLRKKWQI